MGNSVTAIVSKLQNAVAKHYRYVDEIKVKATVRDGCGPNKSAGNRL